VNLTFVVFYELKEGKGIEACLRKWRKCGGMGMGQGWDGNEEKEEKKRKAAFRVCVQTKKKREERPPKKETNHGVFLLR